MDRGKKLIGDLEIEDKGDPKVNEGKKPVPKYTPKPKKLLPEDTDVDTVSKRAALIAMAERGEIKNKQSTINAMGREDINELYNRTVGKAAEERTGGLADVITKFASWSLWGLKVVPSQTKLEERLNNNKLFKQDLNRVVRFGEWLMPFPGLLMGVGDVVDERWNGEWPEENVPEPSNDRPAEAKEKADSVQRLRIPQHRPAEGSGAEGKNGGNRTNVEGGL